MRVLSDQSAGIRASDSERDEIVGELRERFAEGRLTQDTFLRRVDAALHAQQRAELQLLVADLPRRRQSSLIAAVGKSRRSAQAILSSWLRSAPPALLLPSGEQQRFTIGREQACDMTVYDESVSRWHAALERDAHGWLLTDLGSTNGTRVNGWRVNGRVPIRPGDQVTFGALTVVIAEHPARQETSISR